MQGEGHALDGSFHERWEPRAKGVDVGPGRRALQWWRPDWGWCAHFLRAANSFHSPRGLTLSGALLEHCRAKKEPESHVCPSR